MDIDVSVHREDFIDKESSVGRYPNPQGDKKIDVIIRLRNKGLSRIQFDLISIMLPENELCNRKEDTGIFDGKSFLFKSYKSSPININPKKESVIVYGGYEISNYLKDKGYEGDIEFRFVFQDQTENQFHSDPIQMHTEDWLQDMGRFVYYV